ncbi:dihydropteroate synthase [Nocardiopsis mwathae]|uniref:Dihydropteroate synthase n=1 Tax=Nocardiopsis mwathae TaxID=1472723 RepID=A0A7W9YJV5_9ACTN|nr:dihydropteroate synthase [Nocardiopsis mwathae]
MGADIPFQVVAVDAVVDGAFDAGHRPSARRVRELVAGGRPVLVRCATDPADGGTAARDSAAAAAEVIALISVYARLGVRYFATDRPRDARQALDMVASIEGTRPPAVARRGLA